MKGDRETLYYINSSRTSAVIFPTSSAARSKSIWLIRFFFCKDKKNLISRAVADTTCASVATSQQPKKDCAGAGKSMVV